MGARVKKKIIARANIFCSLIPNGFNSEDRKGVDDVAGYIVREYGLGLNVIDAHHIVNLLNTEKIRVKEIVDYVDRYIYCTIDFPSVPPYAGGYDQQPREWIDISGEIKRCIEQVRELRGKLNGGQVPKGNSSKSNRRGAGKK